MVESLTDSYSVLCLVCPLHHHCCAPHLCLLGSATLLQSLSLKLQCQTWGSAACDGSLPEAPLLSPLLGWCLPSCFNFWFAIPRGCVLHRLLFSLLCVQAHAVPTQVIFLRCQKETIFSEWNLALEMIFQNGREQLCVDALVSWESHGRPKSVGSRKALQFPY